MECRAEHISPYSYGTSIDGITNMEDLNVDNITMTAALPGPANVESDVIIPADYTMANIIADFAFIQKHKGSRTIVILTEHGYIYKYDNTNYLIGMCEKFDITKIILLGVNYNTHVYHLKSITKAHAGTGVEISMTSSLTEILDLQEFDNRDHFIAHCGDTIFIQLIGFLCKGMWEINSTYNNCVLTRGAQYYAMIMSDPRLPLVRARGRGIVSMGIMSDYVAARASYFNKVIRGSLCGNVCLDCFIYNYSKVNTATPVMLLYLKHCADNRASRVIVPISPCDVC